MQGNNPYQAPGQPGAGYDQTGQAQQGQQAQQAQGAGWGRLSIYTSHSPFAWILFLVSTGVEIDGQVHKQPWGTSTYDLPEGVHHIKVYYNYLFGPSGIGVSQVQIYAGYTSHLSYKPPIFVFSSADLIESQPQPIHQLPPG